MHLNLFKRKRKKPDKIEIVKSKTVKRIVVFRKHFSKKSIEDNFIQFFHVVRLFFAELFKIRYEFTFEELNTELKKKRIDNNLKERTYFFLKKLSVVEYSNEKLSDSELKKLLSEFLKLFEKLTFNKQKVKETRLDKLLRFFRFKKSTIQKKGTQKKHNTIQNLIEHLILKLKINFNKNELKKIHTMLINALDMIDKNKIQDSKQLYIKIKKKYNNLKIEDKKAVYEDIIFLYDAIISANKN